MKNKQKSSNDSSLLPFNDISDLIRKVDKLRDAHKAQLDTLKASLIKNDIRFKNIGDFGVTIDIGQLTNEKVKFVINLDDSSLKKIYDEVGVIKN